MKKLLKLERNIWYWFVNLPARIRYYGFFNAITAPLNRNKGKSWKKKMRNKVFLKKYKVCIQCKTPYNLTLGHIVERKEGGRENYFNLQLMCIRCNFYKSNNGKMGKINPGQVIKGTYKKI